MKKKILITLLFLLFSASLFASFLQIGPTYTVNMPINKESSTPIDISKVDFNKYNLGIETRINISYLVLDGECRAKFSDELLLESYDIYTSLGLKAKFFFLEFITSIGLKGEGSKDSEGTWLLNGKKEPSLEQYFLSSSLFYKTSMDVNCGSLSLSLSMLFPTEETPTTLNEVKERSVVDAFTPNLNKTTFSVGLLINIF